MAWRVQRQATTGLERGGDWNAPGDAFDNRANELNGGGTKDLTVGPKTLPPARAACVELVQLVRSSPDGQP
jgi:hypothetical protein